MQIMRFSKIVTCVLFLKLMVIASTFELKHDPLQPVWDRIEQLPTKIMTEINERMKHIRETIDASFNLQLNEAKKQFSSILVPSRNPAEHEETKHRLSESLQTAFQNYYNDHMKSDHEFGLVLNEGSIQESLQEIDVKVTNHLNSVLSKADLLFKFESIMEDLIYEVMHHGEVFRESIDDIDVRVSHIRGALTPDNQDDCVAYSDELQRFVAEDLPSEQRIDSFEREWDNTYQAVVKDVKRDFFQRDCNDILLANKKYLSGVYTIYPSTDGKTKTDVWCDMHADLPGDASQGGGWTVVLRRRNTTAGLLDFNRTWEEYSSGFGEPGDEGEWWLGLKWMHQLTYHQPYQLYFIVRDIEKGYYYAHYSNFRVEDESRNFRLIVDGFTGNVSEVFKDIHHGQSFSSPDRDNDKCDQCSCAVNNQGGWWFNVCHRAVLTAPFPTSADREAKTIRWLNSDGWLVLDDVVMMIKPTYEA